MKFILIIMLAFTLSFGSLKSDLEKLSPQQKAVMVKTFNKAKHFDMAWTMTAIAWYESGFGKALVGRTTPDYGVFQINIYTYKRRFKQHIEALHMSDDTIRHILKHDYDVGFLAAVEELKFWQTVRGDDNWTEIWGSYNDGTVIDEAGRKYAEVIRARIALLKQYSKTHKGVLR